VTATPGRDHAVQKITEFVAFNLPMFKMLAIFVTMAVGGAFLFRVRLVNRQWLKICMRLVAAIFVLPLIVFIIDLIVDKSRPRIFISPDSQHIAKYSYDAGFLGRDFTAVVVGGRWSTQFVNVYEYEGPSDWNGTEVRWLNNERLLIRYYPDPERFQQCKTEAEGISVQCESLRAAGLQI
jgi:hypothetical protein